MLYIIGIILKIIGILLLILLGLIILVLIAPISYRLTFSKYEKIEADGKVSWLFHIFTGTFSYHEGNFTGTFRIFGKKFPGSKPKKDKVKPRKKKKESDTSEVFLPAQQEDKNQNSVDYEQIQSAQNALIKESEKGMSESLTEKKIDISEQHNVDYKDQSFHTNKKKKKFLAKEKEESKVKTDKKELKDSIKKILEFLRKPKVVEFLKQIWYKFKHLLKHLLPHKLSANIHFGFSDPSYTGQFLGLLCMFYAYFYKNVNLEPDFEKEILEGKIFVKSRIVTGYLLLLLIKIAYYIFKNKEIINEWNAIRLGKYD